MNWIFTYYFFKFYIVILQPTNIVHYYTYTLCWIAGETYTKKDSKENCALPWFAFHKTFVERYSRSTLNVHANSLPLFTAYSPYTCLKCAYLAATLRAASDVTLRVLQIIFYFFQMLKMLGYVSEWDRERQLLVALVSFRIQKNNKISTNCDPDSR